MAANVPDPLPGGTKKATNGSTKTTTTYQTSRHQETVLHELSDNGAGSFGNFGTANYAGKTLNVRFVELDAKTDGYKSDYENAEAFGDAQSDYSSANNKGGEYADNAVSEQVLAASAGTLTRMLDTLRGQGRSSSELARSLLLLALLSPDYAIQR